MTLSSPPARFAAATSASAAACGSRAGLLEQLHDLLVAHHRAQPVRADAGRGRPARRSIVRRVDLHVRLGAERARDDGAMRMDGRLRLRQPAAFARARRRASGRSSAARARRRGSGRRASRRRGRSPRSPPPRRRRRPLPWCPSRPRSGRERSARRCARWRCARSRRRSPRPGSASAPSSIAAAARREASSPAWAPPMPSATAKSGGSQTNASSFWRRLRPVSVWPAARPSRTIYASTRRSVWPIRMTSPGARSRADVTRAPFTNVPLVEPASSTHRPSARRVERRVPARDGRVAVEPDRVLGPAPDPGHARELDRRPRLERRAGEHDDAPARRRERRAERSRLRGGDDDALLRGALGEPLRGRADDEPDEEVEQHEERHLEREQGLVDADGEPHVSERPKTSSVPPTRDAVAVVERRALRDPAAVDLGPVRRAEVDDGPVRRRRHGSARRAVARRCRRRRGRRTRASARSRRGRMRAGRRDRRR